MKRCLALALCLMLMLLLFTCAQAEGAPYYIDGGYCQPDRQGLVWSLISWEDQTGYVGSKCIEIVRRSDELEESKA